MDSDPTPSSQWSCRFCTFRNKPGDKECLCCETPKEAKAPKISSDGQTPQNSGAKDDSITILFDEGDNLMGNGEDIDEVIILKGKKNLAKDSAFSDALRGACAQCPICGCEFEVEDMESLTEHAALHVSGDSREFSVSINTESSSSGTGNRANRTSNSNAKDGSDGKSLISTRGFTTSFEFQYARAYYRSWSSVQSLQEMQSHVNNISKHMMTSADIETCDTSVIIALREHYRLFPHNSRKIALSTHTRHFSSGYGDRGWGCGYRNIQMLSSALLEVPIFKSLLFGGVGHIPSIPVLQQCLEAAWADGFDPGSTMKKHGVFGGNRWIGTYDAVSLFRNFGIRAEIQTFGAKLRDGENRRANGNNGTKSTSSSDSGLPSNVVSMASFQYRRHQPAIYVPHTRMFEWVWEYFETRKTRGDRVIPPLYLQHDGHSRTIVGAENLNGRIALLLFDPSFPPRDVCIKLREKATVPDVIRKTLSEFRHQNYQIVFVPDTTTSIPEHKRKESKNIRQPPTIMS